LRTARDSSRGFIAYWSGLAATAMTRIAQIVGSGFFSLIPGELAFCELPEMEKLIVP